MIIRMIKVDSLSYPLKSCACIVESVDLINTIVFYIILTQYPKVIIKMISEPDIYKSVISSRNDFFRHGNDKYDC